jgi:glutamate racemase
MGGLTVLAALRHTLPQENFLYLGDTARLPYGTKSPATVRRYAAQAAQLLVDQGVKALVIACNTASAFALEHLSREFAPLPVFGVVEPGAEAAVACAGDDGVLVLATESTIASGAYQRALTARAAHLPVYGRACPLWVTLAEQGPQEPEFVAQVLRYALRGFAAGKPKTLLLGCTHFPVFHTLLNTVLPADTHIVDSAQTTASVVAKQLSQAGLLNPSGEGRCAYFATDGVARFRQVGGYFLGTPIHEVELVDL